jgi:hydrogenase-4 component B
MTFLGLILLAAAILSATAVLTALAARSDRASVGISTAGSLLACFLGCVFSGLALLSEAHESFRLTWTNPIGEFHVGVDPLSEFFLLCVFLVSGLAALYGSS